MKYFAYGMNTNLAQMSTRCPNARSLGAAELPGFQLDFNGCATITKKSNATMQGVLWEITKECEQALDILEGYPSFYYKKRVNVYQNGRKVKAMVYIMDHRETPFAPSQGYYNCLVEGYTNHGMSIEQIDTAVNRAVSYYALTDKDFYSTIS